MIGYGLFAAIFVALIGYGGWSFHYSRGSNVWQRVITAGRCSLTIVCQWVLACAGALISALVWVADVINEPQLAAAIQTHLSPKVVSIIMVTAAVITVIARRRPGSADPVQ